jgi:hypothetical protein
VNLTHVLKNLQYCNQSLCLCVSSEGFWSGICDDKGEKLVSLDKCIFENEVHPIQSNVQMKVQSSAVCYWNLMSDGRWPNLRKLTVFLSPFSNSAYSCESAFSTLNIIRSKYCHVFQWLRRGFGLVNRFIGSSLVVITISSYTLKVTVTTAHVISHTKFSNSSSAVPLELRNSNEVNSHSRVLSYPLGTEHAEKTQSLYRCMAQTTLETSHVTAISPVHWRAGCCLATSCKHSSYF